MINFLTHLLKMRVNLLTHLLIKIKIKPSNWLIYEKLE
jgi:hypothetical protein